MTMDFTARTGEDFPRPEQDGALFAPVPVYARTGKKIRRRPTADDRPAGRADSPLAGVSKVALIAVPVALIAIGGVAYYALRSNDGGFAEMTPGARDHLMVAAAPAAMAPAAAPVMPAPAPAAAPVEPAATDPAVTSSVETTGMATPPPAVRHERPTRVAAAARARPAARTDSSSAASASTTGEDASAVAPAPYPATGAGVEPASPSVPVNPAPLVVPPAPAASVAPAPVSPDTASATP